MSAHVPPRLFFDRHCPSYLSKKKTRTLQIFEKCLLQVKLFVATCTAMKWPCCLDKVDIDSRRLEEVKEQPELTALEGGKLAWLVLEVYHDSMKERNITLQCKKEKEGKLGKTRWDTENRSWGEAGVAQSYLPDRSASSKNWLQGGLCASLPRHGRYWQ